MFNPSHFSLLQVLLDFQRISFCSTFASACVMMLALRSTSQRDLTVGRQKTTKTSWVSAKKCIIGEKHIPIARECVEKK